MNRYLIRRLAQAFFTIWAAYTASFLVLFLLPGDPISIMLDARGEGLKADPVAVQALRERYGFDQPIIVQYLRQIWHLLQGDVGVSVGSDKTVVSLIREAVPHTLALAAAALVLALILGIGLALIATYVKSTRLRDLLLSIPSVAVSIPIFWVGLMLLQFFSFQWHLFPALGNEGLSSLVLPAITLSLPTAAGFAQVFARSLQTSLAQPYADTAYAKGASRLRVHISHAMPNAILPLVTLVGMSVGNLLGGSVIVETVFSRAGIGRLIETAVHARDIPVVQGVIILSTLVYVTASLIVDLVYPLLDPRIGRNGGTK